MNYFTPLFGFVGLLGLLPISSRAAPPAAPSVRIGNFLRGAPCGIAWVIDDSAAFVLDTTGPYVAGTAAPDDSYHAYRFAHGGANIVFEWGRVGDNAVGRLSSDKPVDLDLGLSSGWPGWTSTFTMTPDGATAVAPTAAGPVHWTLRISPAPKSFSTSPDTLAKGPTGPVHLRDSAPIKQDAKMTIAIAPGAPVRFTAGLGNLPGFASVDDTLEKAREKYAAIRPQASGDWGDFVGAIADNMNNSRLYSNDNHRLAHSVFRSFANSGNDSPYFCWDSFFTANLAAIDDPVVARDTVRAMLSYQSPEGLVPNFAHWNGKASMDRSQPPVASLCVWKMHERHPDDREFLAEIYPKLVLWHDWWPKYRDAKHDGLLEWSGLLETGWDDTLHYAGADMGGPTMNVYSVDLSSMWSMDAHYLALIADFLGRKTDAARFRGEQAAMNQRINERLWNSGMNCYCSRFFSATSPSPQGAFLTRLTPMNFYPLSAGAPDATRAQQALRILTDPKKFWGTYPLPTLAYDDPDYPQQEYWRGDVWGPANYLTWVGIKKYASPAQIDEFADRNVELFMKNWLAQGVCGENYLSTDGTRPNRADPHYTWGALLDLIGLESIVDVDDSGQIILNGTLTKTIALRNIPILGRIYDVNTTPGSAELIRDGKVILTARGTIVRAAVL